MSKPHLHDRMGPPGPLTGAYYWVPHLGPDCQVWGLVTCHDLNVWDGVSHRDFWPYVIEHLAAAWSKDAKALKRRLRDHHTGLPRGRIVHPKSGYVVIHGDDAPVPDWLNLVKGRFGLINVEVTPEFTEHERMIGDDPEVLQQALGIPLNLSRLNLNTEYPRDAERRPSRQTRS